MKRPEYLREHWKEWKGKKKSQESEANVFEKGLSLPDIRVNG